VKGFYFKRKEGKYLIILPKELVEDTMFPFKLHSSNCVEVRLMLRNGKLLVGKRVPRLGGWRKRTVISA